MAVNQEPKLEYKTLKEILESVPPGRWVSVRDLAILGRSIGHRGYFTELPRLDLHCGKEKCNGTRFFSSEDSLQPEIGLIVERSLHFKCCNCGEYRKTFAVSVSVDKGTTGVVIDGSVYKLGEFPPFGPPTPSRLITLISPDRELFLKGQAAEN